MNYGQIQKNNKRAYVRCFSVFCASQQMPSALVSTNLKRMAGFVSVLLEQVYDIMYIILDLKMCTSREHNPIRHDLFFFCLT